MRQSLYEYCMENDRPDLLRQWDTASNQPLTPETVTSGSSRKIYWVCEKGHRWQAEPWVRVGRRTGCPVCAGKQIASGINDLRTIAPEVAAEWNYEKNAPLMPETVAPNSHRKVWWKCRVCGHEWLAQVKSRAGTQKCGCPVCAGKAVAAGENDLAVTHPALAAQWHPEKNGKLKPTDVTAGSTRKVWWRCEKGHEWQALISSRTRGCGCPVCANKTVAAGENDLASRYPQLAKEWHPTKNGSLRPEAVTPLSNRNVWWVCALGHEYRAQISARTSAGSGCPYCTNHRVLAGFNDLETKMPKIAVQWHPTLNGNLTPRMVTAGSAKKVWWMCSDGHVWKAAIYSRTGQRKHGCPVCAGKVKMLPKQEYYRRLVSDAKALGNHPDTDAGMAAVRIESPRSTGPPTCRSDCLTPSKQQV